MKNLHSLTIKALLDSVSLPSRCRVLFRYVATLAIFLCLGIGNVWGNDYKYYGDDNWDGVPMTVSSGGAYEYYGPTSRTWHEFRIKLMDGSATYRYTYVSEYFNSTDMAVGEYKSDGCVENPLSVDYYIIIWKPNTDFNATSDPVICASTTLPDDTSGDPGDVVIYSATCIVASRVNINSYTTNQEITASQATITGGKLYVNNGHSSAGGMMRPSIGPSGTTKSAFYMYGSKHSFKVSLNSPTVLQVGDVISAKLYMDSGTYPEDNNGLWFSTSSTRPGSAPTTKATVTSANTWQDISYTITAGDGLVGQSVFYIYYALRTNDSRTAFTDFVITRPSCTAPDHVDIDGRWDYFGGETISLTATAYDDGDNEITTGITGYQWKHNGVDVVGATSQTLSVSNCTVSDAGDYSCVVSTGVVCSTESSLYGTKVYVLQCYTGGATTYNFTRVGDTQTGTAEVTLAGSTQRELKIYAGSTASTDYYMGNNGTIDEDAINWDFEGGKNNVKLNPGLGGTFTFTIDYSANGGAPKVTVTYPRKTIYLTPNSDWKSNSAKFAIYYFRDGGSTGWTDFLNPYICDDNVYIAEIPQWNGVKMNGVRLNNTCTSPDWSDKWDQTSDLTVTSNDHIEITGWSYSQNYTTFSVPTYSISFANGGGSGSMSSLTGIPCEGDQALTVNTFTKSGYFFAYWTADVDVTVGGATITAGDPIANGATIQNITSNIALTANWTERANIPGIVDRYNGATFSGDMTWFGERDEYFDLGPTDGDNRTRWIEWPIHLTASGEYSVSEESYCANGHTFLLELYDGATLKASYTTQDCGWGTGYQSCTQDATWDLSGVTPGDYTLRVKNNTKWGKPKLKSITIAIPFSYTKVPDRELYGDEGDSHRAEGTINNAVVNVPLFSTGAITKNDATRTLTIGSETVVAPETETGRLDNIPYDKSPGYTDASPTWRFDHWDITNLNDIKAVYIPTFPVDYQTNGGIINIPYAEYAHWYRYTGREEDYTELPMDLTKEGFVFAGWYQNSTVQLFSTLPGHYYGGYVKSPSCDADSCDYRLKAHWILDCDEAQSLSKVTLTGSGTSSYTVTGYNEEEYAGTPVVNVSSTYVDADADNDGNNERGYKLDTDGSSIVFATLKKGTFRAGDLVRVVITAPNTHRIISSTASNLTLYYGTGTSDATLLVNIQRIKSDTVVEYYLDADDVDKMELAHATGVGVFRESINGEDPCVHSVEIFGCRDLVFDDSYGNHLWSEPRNWGPTYSEIPSYYQATRINKPCIVDIADAQALNVKLCKQYGDRDGSLVINANAGLEVTQRVSEVHGTDYSTLYPVQASDLVILSNSSNQGALVHGDTEGNTHATVQFYARGNGAKREGNTSDLSTATWQYMGVPFSDVTNAQSHYYAGWMCQWIENTKGNAGSNWMWIVNGNPLYPFTGYCLTQAAAKTYTNTGTLVPSTNQTLTLTYEGTLAWKGWNMFANSWMAPIDVSKFIAADFVGEVEQSIYQFNTGISNGTTAVQGEGAGAGQYVAVPIESASSMLETNRYISPMQGFYVFANASGTNTITLNYNRLVRKSDHSALSVGPNRAKKVEDDEPMMPRVIIDVKGEHFSDRLYVFENAEQTNGFDNGWDGWKFEGESYAPQLMTRTGDLDLAVDVSPAFGGKRIAFRVGEDTEYTLHFSSTEEGLYLRDLSNNIETEITEGGTYTFMAFNTTSEERFEIVDRRAELPDGLEEVTNNATYDILDMTVYTAEGRLVLHRTTDFNKPLNLPQTGAYIINLNTTNGKQVHKIIF